MANQGMSAAVTFVGIGLVLNAATKLVGVEGTAHAAPSAARQGLPVSTIVWYGTNSWLMGGSSEYGTLTMVFRAWSEGTIEAKRVRPATPGAGGPVDWCGTGISLPRHHGRYQFAHPGVDRCLRQQLRCNRGRRGPRQSPRGVGSGAALPDASE